MTRRCSASAGLPKLRGQPTRIGRQPWNSFRLPTKIDTIADPVSRTAACSDVTVRRKNGPVESTRANAFNQGTVLIFVHFAVGEKSGAAMQADNALVQNSNLATIR